VEVELVPDGSPEQRAVVLAALRSAHVGLDGAGAVYLSGWRQAALSEAVERDDPDPRSGYTPSPRSNRGAERA
jgi:hypothetical protein